MSAVSTVTPGGLPADLHVPAYGVDTLADVLPGAAGVLGVLAWAERDRPYPTSGREGDDLRA